jgi:hypothetical protein
MPYKMERNSDGSYRVINADTGDVKAAHTSKRDAIRQIRLLHGVDHGWRPTHHFGRKRT